MGNRAVVSVEGSKVGVYLHWNGGRESVNAFLRAAKDLGVRSPTEDTSYFYARFVQIVGNYFGGTTSVGVEQLSKLDCDNGDNGHFIIDGNFIIISQRHAAGPIKGSRRYQQQKEDEIYQTLMDINRPLFHRIGDK